MWSVHFLAIGSSFVVSPVQKSVELTPVDGIVAEVHLSVIEFPAISQSMIEGDGDVIGRGNMAHVETEAFPQLDPSENVQLALYPIGLSVVDIWRHTALVWSGSFPANL